MSKTKKGTTICSLNDLNFPVELRNNPLPCNKEYSKQVIGVIDGEDFFLNACSNIYELVKNQDIFPEIERVLNSNNIGFSVEYSHTNNVRFYANYRITDKRYAYNMKGTSDFIEPMLRVQHSYNGLTKYKIVFGYFRLVCSNGMIIPVREMNEYNLCLSGKHTSSILGSIEQLDKILKRFAVDAKQITTAIVAKYELLGGRMVANVRDRLIEVLAATKITAVENNKFNTLNDITRRIMEEANDQSLGYNGKVTDFLLYNGINQYLNDDTINIAAPEKRMEIDSKVFEYMVVNV